jgi:hypothetical protein
MKESLQELLDEYALHMRALADAEATGAPADEAAAAASGTANELRAVWTAEDGDPAELDKLLHEADYRERVLALYRGPARAPYAEEYERAREAQKALTVELREFWLSSGHDLRELRELESAVDAEVVDMLIT